MGHRRSLDHILSDGAKNAERGDGDQPPDHEVHGEILAANEPKGDESPDRGVLLPELEHPRSGIEPPPAGFHELDEQRSIGGEPARGDHEEDDERHNEREDQTHAAEIAPQRGKVPSKRIADRGESERPDQPSDRVVDGEPSRRHGRDTGKDSEKAAHDGDETADDDRRRPMAVEKPRRAIETRIVDAHRLAEPRDYRLAAASANPIAGHATGDGAEHGGEKDPDDRERSAAGESGRGDDGCLTGNRDTGRFNE